MYVQGVTPRARKADPNQRSDITLKWLDSGRDAVLIVNIVKVKFFCKLQDFAPFWPSSMRLAEFGLRMNLLLSNWAMGPPVAGIAAAAGNFASAGLAKA